VSRKLHSFVESLGNLLKVTSEDDALETMTNALDRRLSKIEVKNDPELVEDIRVHIERHYKLSSGSLNNAFLQKSNHLTEPKLVWVMCCLHFFKGDRPKTIRLVQNGVSKQTVYNYVRKFNDLGELPHEKSIKENYDIIIKSYEQNL